MTPSSHSAGSRSSIINVIAGACLLAVIALTLMLAPAAKADAPNWVNGNGMTVTQKWTDNRRLDIDVTTTAVQGIHRVIVILPDGYYAHPTWRYPVVYMLHGALAGPTAWITNGGAAMQISANKNVILVIPDGGVKGWYTNWINGAQYSPQNWWTFHNDQVVPFIDRNLRTIANRNGRAIVGLSMGGWGAMNYAETRSDLYRYVAAYSGAVDLTQPTIAATIFGEETSIVPGSGTPAPPGSIFGNLSPGFNQIAQEYTATNPAKIAKLRNTHVDLYSGQGNLQTNVGGGLIESQVKPANDLLAYRMWQAGIDYWYSIDHPRNLGWGCDDNHDQACWNAYFADSLPKIIATLAKP
ncbi:MAG: alpha/beta hydrolase-fold protein [Solirubrobacterales bacterium]